MATIDDIDTQSAVQKFLSRQTVVSREDPTADSTDEIQAILEAVALSFLLYPQSALSFTLRAKNVLQQIVSTDLEIIAYLSAAVNEVNNPNEPVTDTTDLVDAQTALVEIDKVGRVSSDVPAYSRYSSAINSFLNTKLAKSLKRSNSNQFDRTGTEAQQDLYNVLALFGPTHSLMSARLDLLLNAVNDFTSVDLTKIVATQTLSRVRSSLDKLIQGVQNQSLSNTAMAVELLAGSASLSAISNARQVYDPTVQTGSFPAGRSIGVSSEIVPAIATGTSTDTDLTGATTPWVFNMTVNPEIAGGTSISIPLPSTGSSSGRCWIKATAGSPTYNISGSNNTLYVQFDGPTPPLSQPTTIRAVTLPTGGAVTTSAILAALNDVSTGLINGAASEIVAGTGRILILGSSSVTRIVILPSGQGTFDGVGNYLPAAGSAHTVLGFRDEQTSGSPAVFSTSDIADFIGLYTTGLATASVNSGALTIQTASTDLLASLSFGSGVASNFGFSTTTTYETDPSYLQLVENGAAVDPSTLGVMVGSAVTAIDVQAEPSRSLFSQITAISGTQLFFDDSITLPRCSNKSVEVAAPIVFAIQNMLDSLRPFSGQFSSDSQSLQQVLSPLLAQPTQAQINDAQQTINQIQTKSQNLLNVLQNVVVRDDQTQYGAVADQIVSSLTERNLDRALDMLQSCQFNAFFSLTQEVASKSSRFLKAAETVGQNDLGTTTVEQDIQDLTPKASSPVNNLITGQDMMEDQEQV